MSYTPIFTSVCGIAGAASFAVFGYAADVAARCGQGYSNCSSEKQASEIVDSAAMNGLAYDIGKAILCDGNSNDILCDTSEMLSLLSNLDFSIKFLQYYPFTVAYLMLGATLGAAVGGVLDCMVSMEQESNMRRYYR